jgi:hypothetical protein
MTVNGADAEHWLAGDRPGGAVYGAGEHVVIRSGPGTGRQGVVTLLADLEPEPRYLVEIAAGHYVQVEQSALDRGN